MFRYGFAREIITPVLGVPLCGYFNPRPNTGVYDDLLVKALVLEGADGRCSGIVSFDLCFLETGLTGRFQEALKIAGLDFADRILFCATHSHTAPYPSRFFGADPDEEYLDFLAHKAVCAVMRAWRNLAPGELLVGETSCDTLAFNRRYWMKDGKVLTNPGKRNPEIVRPEGPVDGRIPILAFRHGAMIDFLLVNIVNHTDTIGGNVVSADWPGRMERALQNHFGFDIPVMMLPGCSGNINHFDVRSDSDQTSYEEACRIGQEYASVIARALDSLKTVPVEQITVDSSVIQIPFREISEEEALRAEALLERVKESASEEDMTSEGLASGDGPVARFFAGQLLAYRKRCSGRTRDFTLLSIKFGSDIGIVSLPGEPFTEIGMAIRAASRFPLTLVASLGMGSCGYVPMPECFSRGGYEILPVEGGAPAEDTALRLIEAGKTLINR